LGVQESKDPPPPIICEKPEAADSVVPPTSLTEIAEHCDQLRRQCDELLRLQSKRALLSAFIVHDLKTPASTMDLHAQLILRDPQVPLRARESALRIRDEVRRMVRLIMNLLDMSKSERCALTPELCRVDLAMLTQDIAAGLARAAKLANVALTRDLQVTELSADAELLRRVLENLLDNALRHAPEGSDICVTSRAIPRGVELRVRDRGPGIPKELRDKVFEPYVQLEHGARAITRSGRGLGLAFCKLAVEAHGGRIWIEDAGPGAEFCVHLPEVSVNSDSPDPAAL
jgi:two-component system sensor histidine kinase/response regulator